MELSYQLNNSNNIILDKDNFYVIPFGFRCTSALAAKFSSLRKFSLPFDWTFPTYPNKIKEVLKNDFVDFIPDVHNGVFKNKYNIKIAHFNENINDGINEYKRRISRFKKIIKDNKKKYFIYINEDYLYNERFRKKEFNDRIFSQMLELESFLKETYLNIDYAILYFNFEDHKIPPNSKIINVIINTKKLWNLDCPSDTTKKFRHYCGKILSDIFKSSYIPEYDKFTFLN